MLDRVAQDGHAGLVGRGRALVTEPEHRLQVLPALVEPVGDAGLETGGGRELRVGRP